MPSISAAPFRLASPRSSVLSSALKKTQGTQLRRSPLLAAAYLLSLAQQREAPPARHPGALLGPAEPEPRLFCGLNVPLISDTDTCWLHSLSSSSSSSSSSMLTRPSPQHPEMLA
ncbi:hypothetical protein DPEC_G00126510 [Dallia pectoralis]|uniref:Uncharacterized protein n=1 Tax=Dallia pectoralis TaxID=75939 RepID=A0ACC2GRH5_DALPE|nr:hypothetical protein DPEC_G00126510 [Dallia pectoralis]